MTKAKMKAHSAAEVAERFRKQSAEHERLYTEAEARHELADRMIAMRSSCGLTQADLAVRVGRAQPFIARLESGAYDRCALSTLRTFARAMGFDFSFARMFEAISEPVHSSSSSCSDLERTLRLEEISGDILEALKASPEWNKQPTQAVSYDCQVDEYSENKTAA